MGVFAICQREVEFEAFWIALAPVNAVEEAGSVDEFLDHFDLARGEALGIERHVDEFKFGDALGEVGDDVGFGGAGGRVWAG